MPNPVVHWEMGTKDANKLQEFYTNVFGWKIDSNNPMNYGMVETGGHEGTDGHGGVNGGIFQVDDDAPFLTIYIQVDDLQAYLDKAEKMGAKIVMPPTEIPGVVTFAIFTDPGGNRMGLVKG
jgi:predicted enzyme related to lactoylglutathione lyase